MQTPIPVPAAEPRQRWRLVYGRSADAPHLAQRDQLAAWESAIVASGLPVVGLDLSPSRPRIVFAAPLSVGIPAEHEIADLFLTERRPVAMVREALSRHLPQGHVLHDLHDIWLGEPALPGQVIGADYRSRVRIDASRADQGTPAELGASVGSDPADPGPEPTFSPATLGSPSLAAAAVRLMAAQHLPRTREKGGRDVAYDLRPLLAGIEVWAAPDSDTDGAVAEVRVRVRFDPERGVGRPEEVLAALGESAGAMLSFVALVRERVVLATDDGRWFRR